MIDREALLARLAEGHSAAVTVVTPNRRLAAALARDFDAGRAAAGLAAWEAADILPLGAFVGRLYEDALYSALGPQLPIVLTDAQERAVWERIIAASEAGRALLSIPPTAALAADAWRLVHGWDLAGRLGDFPATDDVRAFADWARRYERQTARDGQTDRARLPDVVRAHLADPALRKPRTVVAYGFDIVTSQAQRFLGALAAAGVEIVSCGPRHGGGTATRLRFPSSREELRAAASWARARLEAAPAGRIGIVVPDLAVSGKAVRRALQQIVGASAFNVSLGAPLADHPLAAAALRALELGAGEVDFGLASRVLRSPFIAGAEAERDARASLDAELRRQVGASVTLERLRRALSRLTAADPPWRVASAPVLMRRLADFSTAMAGHAAGSRRPSEWARAIASLLDRLGFPGERPLDSGEYQALKAWHEVLASFAALDRVAGRMRFREARARVARLAAAALFQPQAADVPIQVLGVLESAGLEFDHLWVTGLTDEAWPLAARPNPLVPVALQKAAGVPEAAAETALALDRRITERWLGAAPEVVLSHPAREEDRELAPSSLIRHVPEGELALASYATLREALHEARAEERVPDSAGPPLGSAAAGGTGAFKDQAACPFRAFARHRLGAQALETPRHGLDAAARGKLVHSLLDAVWRELQTQARLKALAVRDVDVLLGSAADAALARLRRDRPEILESRLAAIERQRLIALGRAWLELEKSRAPFEVFLLEEKHSVSFGGLRVNTRLDRMDRVRTATGETVHAVIDYKTGRVSVAEWLGARPDDPQVPLYAVGGDEKIGAAAFARVKTGEMEFRGIASEEGLIPRVRTLAEQRIAAARDYRSWDELLAGWRAGLEALGREFVAGEARVEPKRGEDTCRYCEQHPFCRINERAE